MSSAPLLPVEFTGPKRRCIHFFVTPWHLCKHVSLLLQSVDSIAAIQRVWNSHSGLFIVLPKHKCVHARLFSVYRENNMAGLWASFAQECCSLRSGLSSIIPSPWAALSGCTCLFTHTVCILPTELMTPCVYLKLASKSTSSGLWESRLVLPHSIHLFAWVAPDIHSLPGEVWKQAGSMGVGRVRRGRDRWKVPGSVRETGFKAGPRPVGSGCWRVYLSGSPVAFLPCKCCPHTWSVPCDSRLLTQRRPTTGTLIASVLLRAHRTASRTEGSCRAGAPAVQKRPGNHLGEVRLSGLLCSHGPGWLQGANSCPPFCLPASGGQWHLWSWRGTVPAGEADLILMSCISPWALPPPQSPSWWKVRRWGGALPSLWAFTERDILCKKWDGVCYFVLFLMFLCVVCTYVYMYIGPICLGTHVWIREHICGVLRLQRPQPACLLAWVLHTKPFICWVVSSVLCCSVEVVWYLPEVEPTFLKGLKKTWV